MKEIVNRAIYTARKLITNFREIYAMPGIALLEEGVDQEVSPGLLDLMLEPYNDACRYVRTATFREHDLSQGRKALSLTGQLCIPSCYYARNQASGPGHFNATEFILGFNQLAYCMLAQGIEQSLLPELGMSTAQELKDAQMERCYIGKIKEICFRKPIIPQNFLGTVRIDKTISRSGRVFYSVDTTYGDAQGGSASGKFTIAILGQN